MCRTATHGDERADEDLIRTVVSPYGRRTDHLGGADRLVHPGVALWTDRHARAMVLRVRRTD
ncbi:hypothetical protein [Streptomyces sp. NPDC004726]